MDARSAGCVGEKALSSLPWYLESLISMQHDENVTREPQGAEVNQGAAEPRLRCTGDNRSDTSLCHSAWEHRNCIEKNDFMLVNFRGSALNGSSNTNNSDNNSTGTSKPLPPAMFFDSPSHADLPSQSCSRHNSPSEHQQPHPSRQEVDPPMYNSTPKRQPDTQRSSVYDRELFIDDNAACQNPSHSTAVIPTSVSNTTIVSSESCACSQSVMSIQARCPTMSDEAALNCQRTPVFPSLDLERTEPVLKEGAVPTPTDLEPCCSSLAESSATFTTSLRGARPNSLEEDENDASPFSSQLRQRNSCSTSVDCIQHIFLFYNPMSGCQAASVLANPELRQADLYFGNQRVRLRLWDIREGEKHQKPGFLRLRELLESLSPDPATTAADAGNTVSAASASQDESEENKPLFSPLVRVIAAGGDGTVMWCISELRAHGIDLSRIAIGVIPFGTGNDFARVLSWSTSFSGNVTNPKKTLRNLARQWVAADIILHDLWDVEVQVHETGVFKHVDPTTRSKQVMTQADDEGQPIPVKSASFKMCNYFSIGVESRIGVSFDRYRTSSQFWNKIRYAAEGLKKSFFKHTLKVNEIVSQMSSVDPTTGALFPIYRCPCPEFVLEKPRSDSGYTFSPSVYSRSSGGSSDSFSSAGADFVSLPAAADGSSRSDLKCHTDVFNEDTLPSSFDYPYSPPHGRPPSDSLSVPRANYFPNFPPRHAVDHNSLHVGSTQHTDMLLPPTRDLGALDPHANVPYLIPAASLIAINIPSFAAGLDIWKSAQRVGLSALPDGSGVYPLPTSLCRPQRLGDGILEFITFSSAASMGFERMSAFHGRGKKVCQGQGPFYLHFHDLPRDCRVYFQVDGEFYLMNCPRQVSLSHDCTIRVLALPQSPYRENYITPSH